MDNTTRIIGIDLRVLAGNSFKDLTIFNVYAPLTHGNDIKTVENFGTKLKNDVISLQKENIPIIGGDTNARIGNRLYHPDSDEQYFGPWGNEILNKARTKVVLLMHRCALRDISTLYQHKKYWTYKSHLQKELKTLDHFLMNSCHRR